MLKTSHLAHPDFCDKHSMQVSQYATRGSALAAMTVLMYDYVLVFEDEIEFVWKISWSFGKALYIANRYIGIGALLFSTVELFQGYSNIPCAAVIQYRIWTRWATLCFIEVLLLARVYAIYNRNKRLLASLIILFLAEFGTIIVFLYAEKNSTITETTNPIVSNCFYQSSHTTLVTSSETWLPLFLYVGMLCMLMVYKAWSVYREDKPGKFYQSIIRDCLKYYFSIFLVVCFNFMFYMFLPATNPQWSLPWLSAIPVLVASRLFLNTRQAYYKDRAFPSLNVTAALMTRPS